jgi:hypothetical protein
VEHEGREFPAVEYEGEYVVEAYLHKHDTLPHLHSDLENRFPRAVASKEEAETEDVTPCGFEQRGEKLGKVGCVVKADTTTTTTKTPTTGATTTTKPANDGGHDYDHDKEEAKKEASGGKNKEEV